MQPQPTTLKKEFFLWKGTDRHGIKTNGIIKANNIEMARAQVERNQITISRIKKQPLEIFPTRIKSQDITFMTRQLATMTRAGLTIIQALDTIIESTNNNALKALILKIKENIASGSSLNHSLSLYPRYFDTLFVSLCKVGEHSGTLDIMLNRIASHRETVESIKKKIKKALNYPIIVTGTAIAVTLILLNVAIPAFAEIFQAAGAALPLITRITINLSEWTQHWWWLLALILFLSIMSFKFCQKHYPVVRDWQDYALLKLPIIGTALEKSSLARFARTLETTIAAGMPITDALKIVSSATGNAKFKHAILFINDRVANGKTMTQAAAASGVFPGIVLQMISIGEESGQLEEMLGNIASVYEEDVDLLVSNLSSAIEPVIMIILGCLVGFLVVSMYLPMFSLGNAL